MWWCVNVMMKLVWCCHNAGTYVCAIMCNSFGNVAMQGHMSMYECVKLVWWCHNANICMCGNVWNSFRDVTIQKYMWENVCNSFDGDIATMWMYECIQRIVTMQRHVQCVQLMSWCVCVQMHKTCDNAKASMHMQMRAACLVIILQRQDCVRMQCMQLVWWHKHVQMCETHLVIILQRKVHVQMRASYSKMSQRKDNGLYACANACKMCATHNIPKTIACANVCNLFDDVTTQGYMSMCKYIKLGTTQEHLQYVYGKTTAWNMHETW